MKSNHYAEINADGICFAQLESSGTTDAPNMIPIAAGEYRLGQRWVNNAWQVVPEPPAPPEQRYIFVGSFFDRFGAHKWPILADTNPMVQALVKDCQVRRYIDLDNPELPSGLAMLVQAGHAIDPDAVINAPITEAERWVG